MKRIFVVGCPRSGTTLVQSLLAAAPGATSFKESHFFDKHFRRSLAGYAVTPTAKQALSAFNVENDGAWKEELAPARVGFGDQRIGSEAAGQAFIALLDALAVKRGASCWVEKTPDHLFRLDIIRRCAPDAHFVLIVRRPGPTIASLVEASALWGRRRGWWAFALKWCVTCMIVQRTLTRTKHQVIFYEDITAKPDEVGENLFRSLDLPWTSAALTRQRTVGQSLVTEGEIWKRHISKRIGEAPVRLQATTRIRRGVLAVLDRFYESLRSRAARVLQKETPRGKR